MSKVIIHMQSVHTYCLHFYFHNRCTKDHLFCFNIDFISTFQYLIFVTQYLNFRQKIKFNDR